MIMYRRDFGATSFLSTLLLTETRSWVCPTFSVLVGSTGTTVELNHARVLRTLADGRHAAGFEIEADPLVAKHRRTMGDTSGAVASVVTDENEGVYLADPHIPLPNTPDVRGIGIKWPRTTQGDNLTLANVLWFWGLNILWGKYLICHARRLNMLLSIHHPCAYTVTHCGAPANTSLAIYPSMGGKVGLSPLTLAVCKQTP